MLNKKGLFNFTCSTGKLYAAALLGWQNYLMYQPAFEAVNSNYTVQAATDAEAAIEAARTMPDVSVRRDVAATVRNQLSSAAKTCTTGWQLLASYIEDAFPADDVANRKIRAGYASYADANNEVWDKVVSLNQAAVQFIKDNAAVLAAGGMSAGFARQYEDGSQRFANLYVAYNAAKQIFNVQTTEKSAATNAVYKSLLTMLRDGKKIYRNDARTRDLFTFSSLVKKVSGDSRSGFRIALKLQQVLTPVTTASISFLPGGSSFAADAKGIIMAPLAEGTYSFTLTAPGFTTVTGTWQVSKGRVHRKAVVMAHAAESAAIA